MARVRIDLTVAAFILGCVAASAGAARAADEVKLPPGTKLPPQPRSWLAPPAEINPPPQNGRWGAGGWTQGRSLPLPLAGHEALYHGRYVYVVGGVSGRETLGRREVWRSKRAKDGRLGAWKKTSPLPKPVAFGRAVVAGERLYVVAGASREGMQNLYRTVYSAAFKSNGSLASWREERPLPEGIVYHAAAACDGRLYVLGGFNGQEYTTTLRYAPLEKDGSLGAWREAAAAYPHPIGRTVMVCVDDDLVVIGGLWSDAQGEHITSLIMRGSPAEDGDVKAWKPEGGLKIASRALRFSLAEHAGLSDGRYVYLFGGRDPDSLGVSTSQASWIDPRNGKMTRWQFGPALPLYGVLGAPQEARLYQSAAVIAGDDAYVLGGFVYIRTLVDTVWRHVLRPYEDPVWLNLKPKR